MKEFDYIPLDAPVTKSDIDQYRATYPKTLSRKTYILIAAIFLVITLFINWVIFYYNGDESILIGLVLSILIVPGGTAAAYWVELIITKNHIKLRKFASINGGRFAKNIYNPRYNGMIFDNGYNRKVSKMLIFDDFSVGNYSYVTGSGKNSQTHNYGFLKVKLPRRLPHFVLDARSNNTLGISNLNEGFDRSQKLSLEGDFDKHFTLYAPESYRQDALYVLTPDVMQTFIRHAKDFDIEIIDDMMYLYANNQFNLTQRKVVEPLFSMVLRLANEVRGQSKYYTDDNVINARTLNQVAEPGMRLKKNGNLLFITIFLFIFFMAFTLIFLMN